MVQKLSSRQVRTSTSLLHATSTPGLYTTAQFQIEGGDVGYISSSTTNTLQFNLSQFGAIGQYIDMTFNGTYVDNNTGTTKTINGVVHVLRDN